MIVVAVLGMFLPGYALARALRLPGSWAAAFPLSALVLAETVVAFTLLGIPLRFRYVLGTIAVVSLLPLAACSLRSPAVGGISEGAPRPLGGRALRTSAVLLAVAVLLSMGVRSALFPLSGYDTLFRWDNLARMMLAHEGLSFYPPVTHDDFRKYLYPDGFPPLAPAVYWWLYAAWGGPCPAMTALAVASQAASCLALTHLAARVLFGPPGGWLALAALSSSSLFLRGLAIGQETGYTALAVAGQLAFALAAVRTPGAALVAAAGLCAGLGGLAREYGPALAAVGFAVLAVPRETRRFLPLFCLVALACAGPWYVRTWVRTGNPLYPLDLGLGLPVNPVHADLFALYRTIYGVQGFSPADWLRTATLMVQGAPLAVLAGVPGLVVAGKRTAGLAASVVLVGLLWLNSVGYTSGPFGYHLRVLTPAWVVLAVAAGVFGPPLLTRATGRVAGLARALAVLTVVACGGYAVLSCWSHPRGVGEILGAIRVTRSDPLDSYPFFTKLARMIDRSGLPAAGVLTDNSYLAVALQRCSRFHPVMVWDPEVAFVFDPRLSPVEVRRRLLARGIALVGVQQHSINNRYLFRHRFYREDRKDWIPAWVVPGRETIFLLPPPDGPRGADDPRTGTSPAGRRPGTLAGARLHSEEVPGMNRRSLLAVGLLALMPVPYAAAAEPPVVVVYGGTPGGIAAAVAAARADARVTLIETTRHVGGLNTSGLNTSELEHMIGPAVTGFPREFYTRVNRAYGKEGPARLWESHVAERAFLDLLAEAKVAVRLGRRLDRVEKDGTRIRSIILDDGSAVAAAVFVDATYEGDLLARAGVSYAVGREAPDRYGEPLAGIRFVDAPIAVSPYDDQGQLLPGFVAPEGITPGQGDGKVLCYNFRLCLTRRDDNKVPIARPEHYDRRRYLMLERYLAAHPETRLRDLIDLYGRPHEKYETNNKQAAVISLGHFGGQFAYPEADAAARAAIVRDHEDYERGFLWFLGHDPAAPEALRAEMLTWGLARDEFADNGNWPYQLYIREARRMEGAFVMTQRDVQDERDKPDAIALGSHWIDAHHVQRVAVARDRYRNEGRIWEVTHAPYEIPYRALTPRAGQCANLLVPVCLSASHVAFCSLRVEPTWMATGQAAGVAAALAARADGAVQEVDAARLQEVLNEQGVVLDRGAAAVAEGSR